MRATAIGPISMMMKWRMTKSCRPLRGLDAYLRHIPGVPLTLHPRLYSAARIRGLRSLQNVGNEKVARSPNSTACRPVRAFAKRHSHSRDRYVLLAPGQSYKTTETITIDKGYFQIKKLYELTVSYLQLRPQTVRGVAVWVGMIESNKIKVRILACPDKNPDTDKNRPAKDNSEE